MIRADKLAVPGLKDNVYRKRYGTGGIHTRISYGVSKSLCTLDMILYWLYKAIKKSQPFTLVQASTSLSAEQFRGIKFSSILSNPGSCMIVVGAKQDHGSFHKGAIKEDWDAAQKLKEHYGISRIKTDTDLTSEDIDNYNIISVGGPLVNTFTHDTSSILPIQVANIVQGGISMKGAYSAITSKYYQGREFGFIEALPNKANPRLATIIAFGLNREGTIAAVNALIQDLQELDKMNKHDKRYPARLVKVSRDDQDKIGYQFEE